MGNSTPDQESAHDHELVTEDELLVDGGSSPVAGDALDSAHGLRLQEFGKRSVPIRAGEILAGKYRVERVHAPGALGVTCDAEHLQLRQRVVVKLCTARPRQSEAAARFLESARLAAQLRNSHLARVFDLGILDSGIPYSVTEHLSGTDLRGVLRVREWLPVSEAVDYAIQVCEALAVAHAAGFVHRNLKPANVFLARESDGRPIVKVLDFCLADGSLTEPSIAMAPTESQVRSLAYLAPEQVRDPSSADLRADIWALGALLHELLTGSPVYNASSVPGIFAAIAADNPMPITQLRGEIPRELEEIVLRCLEKERDYRWPDVGTLAKQLRRFASEEASAAVERVIMLLERRARSPRSSLPPPLLQAEAPPPAAREVSTAVGLSSNRRLLEMGLAVLAILGCSVGIGAFITIRNLQSILATRSASAQPAVANLSALRAAPAQPVQPAPLASAPAGLKSAVAPQPAPQVTPAPPKVWSKPPARAQVEAPASSLATVAPQRAASAEPATSTQALFDSAN